MVAPFLGGHWSVVVPPVVSASPVRHWAECYPRSRTVQAGDTIVHLVSMAQVARLDAPVTPHSANYRGT